MPAPIPLTIEQEVAQIGYVSRSVPKDLDLKEEIRRMKAEKNASARPPRRPPPTSSCFAACTSWAKRPKS